MDILTENSIFDERNITNLLFMNIIQCNGGIRRKWGKGNLFLIGNEVRVMTNIFLMVPFSLSLKVCELCYLLNK